MTGGNQPRWLFHWTIRVCSFALVVCFANFGFSLTTPHFVLSLPMDTFFPVSNKRLIAHEENPIVHLSLLKLIHCFLSGTLFRGSKWGDMAFTANGWNFSHSRAKLISFLFNYDYNIQNVLRHFPSIMSFVTCTSKHFHIKQTTNVPTKGHGSASFWYKVIYLIGKTKEF